MARLTGSEGLLQVSMFGSSIVDNSPSVQPSSDISCLNPASLDLSLTSHNYEHVTEPQPFEDMYPTGLNTLHSSEKQPYPWFELQAEDPFGSLVR